MAHDVAHVTDASGKQPKSPIQARSSSRKAKRSRVQAMNPDAAAEPSALTANGYEAYYGPVEGQTKPKKTFAIIGGIVTCPKSSVSAWSGGSRSMAISSQSRPPIPRKAWRVTYERL